MTKPRLKAAQRYNSKGALARFSGNGRVGDVRECRGNVGGGEQTRKSQRSDGGAPSDVVDAAETRNET